MLIRVFGLKNDGVQRFRRRNKVLRFNIKRNVIILNPHLLVVHKIYIANNRLYLCSTL